MADKSKKKEPKMVFEREYTVPLREEWLKVAKYKRANKAMKALKEFMVRHMKVYDRDLRKIKVDQVLNNEMRFRGMRKPLSRVKVKAQKFDDDTVRVFLVNVPDHVKFARLREEKIKANLEKKVKEEKKAEEKKTEKKEETSDAKEKEAASKEESMKISEEQAKEQKHVSKLENPKERKTMHKNVQRGR